MGIVTTLRKAIDIALAEAEDKAVNILVTINDAVDMFVNTVFDAANAAAQQIVDIVFGLAETAVTEAFNIAEAVVTVVLGDAYDSDSENLKPGVSTVEADKEAD